MPSKTILVTAAFAFASWALAQDVDSNDYPTQCQAVCSPVSSLTQQCDLSTNDNDTQERNCICQATNASTIIPLCAACYAQYDATDANDNDVLDLVRACSFNATTYNPTAIVTGTATANATRILTVSATASATILTIVNESGTATTTIPPTRVTSTATGTSGGDASSTGGAVANGVGSGLGVVAAVVFAGLL